MKKKSKKNIVLAIDPGVRKLGYAVVEDDCTILDAGIVLQDKKSPTREDQFLRIAHIIDFFEKMLTEVDISLCVLEKLFFTESNQTNAEFMYGVRGALIAMFLSKGIPSKEYTPIQLKKYVTWNGKADKLFVQKMIMKIYRLADMPEYNDAADALWLAYMAIKSLKK